MTLAIQSRRPLPKWHHDNPWRKAQRTNSLTLIRQRHNPFQNCRILSSTSPDVSNKLNAEVWLKAIAETIRPLPLRCHDFYTSELLRHAQVCKGPLLSLIHDRSNIQLGLVLLEISKTEYSRNLPCYLSQIPGDRKRARWVVAFPQN